MYNIIDMKYFMLILHSLKKKIFLESQTCTKLTKTLISKVSKVDDRSRRQPEGSFFIRYYLKSRGEHDSFPKLYPSKLVLFKQ